jgi:hypothetical protein
MLKIIGFGLLALVVGYGIGLFGGMWLVNTFSNNPRDRELEAAMTGAFVIGPVMAILALVGTVIFLLLRARG